MKNNSFTVPFQNTNDDERKANLRIERKSILWRVIAINQELKSLSEEQPAPDISHTKTAAEMFAEVLAKNEQQSKTGKANNSLLGINQQSRQIELAAEKNALLRRLFEIDKELELPPPELPKLNFE